LRYVDSNSFSLPGGFRIPRKAALAINPVAKEARSSLAKFQYYARIELASTVGTLVYPV
jgi:hypothetical protein